jgi:hypothetical protein
MSSELIDWVYAYLVRDEDIIVPIKKMWNEWHNMHREPALAEFTEMILADERVEEMGGIDHNEGMEWMTPEELVEHERDMEGVGFFSGPRVKLKSREITLEHITRMMKKHNDRMEGALRAAHATMPDDIDEHEEGMLLDTLGKVETLRQHLRELGLEPDDTEEEEI